MNLTIRLFLLVAVAILPALVIETYNEYTARARREAQVRDQAVRLGEQTAGEMRQIIEGIQRVAVTLAQVPLVNEAATGAASPEACSALLMRLLREYPGQLSLGVAGPEGRLVCTTGGTPTTYRVRGSHFRHALETGRFVVGGYGDGGREQRYLTFAGSVANPDVGSSASRFMALVAIG